MERNSKTAKALKSATFPVDHGMYNNFSSISRCNSFSSSSNDSAVYCSSNTVEYLNGNRKRIITDNQSSPFSKRSRNSSGSSLSSNFSFISDKDSKNSHTQNLQNSLPKTGSRLNNVGESQKKHKENGINTPVISGTQRSLRNKITRKRCSCCPSPPSILIRHVQQISVNSEEKKVISRTRLKTYIKKNSVPRPTDEKKIADEIKLKPAKPKAERRRRSEIDKLYASLHEIEWAKNFSPDNILRQIHVRQAASCSIFGRPSIDKKTEPCSKSKKSSDYQKDAVKQTIIDSGVSKSCNNVSKPETKIKKTCESKHNHNLRRRGDNSCSKSVNVATSSESSISVTACSVAHMNYKENDSTKSICSQSLIRVNETDCASEGNLSFSSDESSSSALHTDIAKIQSKQILDFGLENKSNTDFSDTNVTDYTTPTFFDIAEEGIRTIDACFREVGAEVVVSTCYEDESSLPLLTSVKENGGIAKASQNDTPPVLEPCVNISGDQSFKIVCNDNIEKSIKTCKTFDKISVNNDKQLMRKNTKNCNVLKNQFQKNFFPQSLNKCMNSFEKSHCNFSILYAGRRILKKYVKYTKSKVQFENLSNVSYQSDTKIRNGQKCFSNETCNGNSHKHSHISVLSPVSLKSREVTFKTTNEADQVTVIQTNQYTLCNYKDRINSDYSNKSSCLVEKKEIKHKVENGKTSIIAKSETCISEKPLSSYTSPRNGDGKICTGTIPRPSAFGFSCHYKTITVNRHNNYTQIILKLTRGTSIFLTLEALTELKDVLNRSSNDSSCQVLIINGIGKSFCLGIDLKPLIGPRKKLACTEMAVAIKELVEALADFKKPLAVVVNGPAVGLGMTLLNHADLTIASKEATFCMPYSNLCYIPEGGATLTLPQIVGSTLATELLLNGRTMTAEEACNAGLVTSVVEAKCLPQVLVSRIRELAKDSLSALETTKHMMKMQLHVNLQLVLENEVKLLPCMWLTQTCQNAMINAMHSGILSE